MNGLTQRAGGNTSPFVIPLEPSVATANNLHVQS